MKKKNIFALALAGILLTACGSGGGVSDEISAENPSESEVTATLETELTETVTTEETEEEVPEKEAAEITGSTSSDYFDYFTFDLGRFEVDMEDYPFALSRTDFHKECRLLSKNILCAVYQLEGDGVSRYLRFYDIDKGELAAEIPLPEGSNFSAYSCENGGEDVLVKVYTVNYGTASYGEVTVYKDYSYDITDDGMTPYPGIDYYNTGVYGSEPGAFDLENLRTDTVLVEGGENGLALFGTSIDENRFAFLKREYDKGTSYIGIYDYETGEITEIPNSDVLEVIGYYNGKIYAYTTNTAEIEMDGCIGEIYSFDVQTLEKEVFMTFHTPDDSEGRIYCFMEQDKGYMAAALSYTGGSNSEETAYVISLDSGEIVAKHEKGGTWDNDDGEIRGITCADGRVALINFGTDKLLVLDKK